MRRGGESLPDCKQVIAGRLPFEGGGGVGRLLKRQMIALGFIFELIVAENYARTRGVYFLARRAGGVP